MRLEVRGEIAYAATGGPGIDPDLESVVFIHGVGQDHTIWVLPTRYFARHDRNVLAVDLPGHGRSSGPPLETIEEMADWVVQALDAAGIDRAAFVGHSMGSLVALDAAARHPDRVRSLALVGVSFPLAVADQLSESAQANSHDAIEMLTYWGHSSAAQIGGSPTPGMWMTGASMRLWERAAPGVIHTDLKACDGYDAGSERASKVECPTLLLLGERDRMTPVRGAESIRRAIPDQDTVIFRGAGHPLLLERSDPVLDQLIRVV
ncbi:MAG: alpha/beta hydrolase [Acidimicrobiia bacterium]|jgi:pimeloyl-ACP methyl ester carboxylesterase